MINSTIPQSPLAKALLHASSRLFSWGVGLRHALFDWGFWQTQKVDVPVISVGGLEVGGSGKTPVVGFLIHACLKAGLRPALLSRGYGRTSRQLVLHHPQTTTPPRVEEVGDEPAMLARQYPQLALGISPKRQEAALQLITAGIDILILDDGFNHRQLHRDLDIVVMRPEWDISTAHMLPKGRLREPPSALKRADVLWLHHKATTPPNIPNWLPTEKQHCTSFTKYHLLDISDNLADVLLLQNVIGVCGVAHPPAFFNVLDPLVQHCCAKVAYPDHHQFSIQDVDRLLETMKHHAATACVVTPKDAIKLRELWPPAETKQLLVLHNEVHLSTLCDEWQLFFHILPSVWQRTPTMHDNSIS